MNSRLQFGEGAPLAPARQGGREAAPLLRLEESTYSDEHPNASADEGSARLVTRAKVRHYPDGSLEVTCIRRPRTVIRLVKHRVVSTAIHEVTKRDLFDTLSAAAERASAMVRRSIMAGGLDHMLTLTFRENITDPVEADKKLTLFLRKARDYFRSRGVEFFYVAVPERQKRGAIHFHLAVKGWQPVRLLRHFWVLVVGAGNIDVRSWSGRPNSSACHLARYLSKYMSKAIWERACGMHRYRRSHNIRIEERVEEFEEPELDVVVTSIFRRDLGVAPAFTCRFALGPFAPEFLWACSWGGRSNK